MSPPVFVNYRRADEPYAAALLFAVLHDRWDGDVVFLDTRFLRQGGSFLRQKADVGPQLLDAVAGSELVLAVIGPRWDDDERRRRLSDPGDWVRCELVTAARAGKRIVPVLVDRPDVPTNLPFEPVPNWTEPFRLHSSDFWGSVGELVNRASTVLGAPTGKRGVRTARDLVPLAVDAMLRHVLPVEQQRMGNDAMVAGTVAGQLGDREWLRFATTANLPRRPNGSCIVWVSDAYLGAADLDSNFRPRTRPSRIPVAKVRASRRDGQRLWKRVSDLQFDRGDGTFLDLEGFFAEEADELLEALEWVTRASARPC